MTSISVLYYDTIGVTTNLSTQILDLIKFTFLAKTTKVMSEIHFKNHETGLGLHKCCIKL